MSVGNTWFSLPDLDQLTQILKVTGSPGEEFVQKLEDKAVRYSVLQFRGKLMFLLFLKSLTFCPTFINDVNYYCTYVSHRSSN